MTVHLLPEIFFFFLTLKKRLYRKGYLKCKCEIVNNNNYYYNYQIKIIKLIV